MPNIPGNPKFYDFPTGDFAASDIVRLYEGGARGAYVREGAKEELHDLVRAKGLPVSGTVAGSVYGWAGAGEGKLVAPWVGVEKCFPGCLPGPAQARGDCVSHSTKNAALFTMVGDILDGKPDEQTGKIEGVPDVSPEGIKNGVLSTEAIYWWRGHGGDGWECSDAAQVLLKESGLWLRKDYPGIADLTRYSGSTAGKWGSRSPGDDVRKIGAEHLAYTVVEVDSFESCRDLLANGYGISSCGGEGWSSSRDENGFSRRSGSWSHAMAYIGADDRDIVKQKYGGPLVLIQNSWAVFNSGGRRVLGTELDIPEGSFWAKWSDCTRRDAHAFSSVNGWPSKKLPDYGATGII